MKIKFVCAWYDPWVGSFWDRKKRRLYILLLPCIGFSLENEFMKKQKKEKLEPGQAAHDMGESVGRFVGKVVLIGFGLGVISVFLILLHFLIKLW